MADSEKRPVIVIADDHFHISSKNLLNISIRMQRIAEALYGKEEAAPIFNMPKNNNIRFFGKAADALDYIHTAESRGETIAAAFYDGYFGENEGDQGYVLACETKKFHPKAKVAWMSSDYHNRTKEFIKAGFTEDEHMLLHPKVVDYSQLKAFIQGDPQYYTPTPEEVRKELNRLPTDERFTAEAAVIQALDPVFREIIAYEKIQSQAPKKIWVADEQKLGPVGQATRPADDSLGPKRMEE